MKEIASGLVDISLSVGAVTLFTIVSYISFCVVRAIFLNMKDLLKK